jgi:transposase
MKKHKVERVNELKEYAKKEKNQKTRDRFKALLLLDKGVKVKTICSVFDIHEDVLLYRWLPKWNSGNVENLTDKQRSGRPPLIKKALRKELREYVLSQDRRIVCKDLVDYVKKRWDIDCDDETLRKVLKNMKLSWQKPDKINHKADEEKKKVFLKGALWC